MLFHLGVLWRLNEWGYLRKIDRFSSVSGGSITAGLLGVRWDVLGFDSSGVAARFDAEIVRPIRDFAGKSIDVGSVIGGILTPGKSIGEKVAAQYDRHLYKGATLQNLPGADGPRFVINATNVQSGALCRFSRPFVRDYRVGELKNSNLRVALAVTASSAFPPPLSPLRIKVKEVDFTPKSGTDLQRPPFTAELVLTDGGVYDNLGLETVWKRYTTVLVSNAGGRMGPQGNPKGDWLNHTRRVLDLVDNQVRALRKRQVIGSLRAGLRRGAYWAIQTNIADYGVLTPAALPCPHEKTLALAAVPTRLSKVEKITQEKLINWGYAVCDAAMRRHVNPALGAGRFPYPPAAV